MYQLFQIFRNYFIFENTLLNHLLAIGDFKINSVIHSGFILLIAHKNNLVIINQLFIFPCNKKISKLKFYIYI